MKLRSIFMTLGFFFLGLNSAFPVTVSRSTLAIIEKKCSKLILFLNKYYEIYPNDFLDREQTINEICDQLNEQDYGIESFLENQQAYSDEKKRTYLAGMVLKIWNHGHEKRNNDIHLSTPFIGEMGAEYIEKIRNKKHSIRNGAALVYDTALHTLSSYLTVPIYTATYYSETHLVDKETIAKLNENMKLISEERLLPFFPFKQLDNYFASFEKREKTRDVRKLRKLLAKWEKVLNKIESDSQPLLAYERQYKSELEQNSEDQEVQAEPIEEY